MKIPRLSQILAQDCTYKDTKNAYKCYKNRSAVRYNQQKLTQQGKESGRGEINLIRRISRISHIRFIKVIRLIRLMLVTVRCGGASHGALATSVL